MDSGERHQPGIGSVQGLLPASQTTRRRLQLAVRAACVFCTLAMPPGYGCQDHGWPAGVRVLMFPGESEERTTELGTR